MISFVCEPFSKNSKMRGLGIENNKNLKELIRWGDVNQKFNMNS
jgi:hypothetical protein